MKRILSIFTLVLLLACTFSVNQTFADTKSSVQSESDEISKQSVEAHTIDDLIVLQDFLACKRSDGNGTDFDLNHDGVWNVFDLCLLKQTVAENMVEESTDILVAYFSCTGNTETIAGYAADYLSADTYEIIPEVPYTAEDLNYTTSCRANDEQNNPSARPAISGGIDNMEDYEIILIGYPIWWGQAPKIISTFLESYDFSDKTIIPFCTSGSSEISASVVNLQTLTSDSTTWLDGRRFSGNASESSVREWIDSLALPISSQDMQISVKSEDYEVIYALNKSSAAKELYAQLPITVDAEPYSNNEITFYPEKLNTSDSPLSNGETGSLSYYAPWGDVVMFYAPCNPSSSLYEIGTVVSGTENIEKLSGTLTVSVYA